MALAQDLAVMKEMRRRQIEEIPGAGVTCRGCGAKIWFLMNERTGRSAPFDADGESHFSTCPKAYQFRRKGR